MWNCDTAAMNEINIPVWSNVIRRQNSSLFLFFACESALKNEVGFFVNDRLQIIFWLVKNGRKN